MYLSESVYLNKKKTRIFLCIHVDIDFSDLTKRYENVDTIDHLVSFFINLHVNKISWIRFEYNVHAIIIWMRAFHMDDCKQKYTPVPIQAHASRVTHDWHEQDVLIILNAVRERTTVI